MKKSEQILENINFKNDLTVSFTILFRYNGKYKKDLNPILQNNTTIRYS